MMVEAKDMVCIVCPLGCKLKVTKDNASEAGFAVEGNKCPRGLDYGIKEMTNPTRVLTTTVKITHAALNRIPVRTKGAIPKPLIFQAMKLMNEVEVKAPVKVGQVVIKNILGTGIDVIASRSIYKKAELNHYFCHSQRKDFAELII
ncbi:DUF1667 domain-containing protein [Anaerovirgula multivorans]|nr:DUF1667 domain-containing protein [Anaerovirgula multivorans]